MDHIAVGTHLYCFIHLYLNPAFCKKSLVAIQRHSGEVPTTISASDAEGPHVCDVLIGDQGLTSRRQGMRLR